MKMMNAATTGRKCIAWSIGIIATAWLVFVSSAGTALAAELGPGFGVIVVLTFVGAHKVGAILALIGTAFLLHAMKNATETRTTRNILATTVGAATCAAATWYAWFLKNG